MRVESFASDALCARSIMAGGGEVPYRASFDRLLLSGGAEVTAVSYTAEGAAARRGRPVAFVTNGGPGSSSLWLHVGFLGPRRVRVQDELSPPVQPPFELEDNPHCLLDLCDLVFIDMPGTGLSSAPDEASRPELFSVDGDALACALFIERWIDARGRADAPIYLVGESYGTLRMAAVADALMGGPFSTQRRAVCLPVAGIVLMGTAFSTAPSLAEGGPVEECVLALSACAAVCAHHHPGRIGTPREAYEAGWDLAPDYHRALFMGSSMDPSGRERLAARLEELTCIPAAELLDGGLRFSVERFRQGVVPGRCAGAYDGRYLMDGPGRPGSFPYPGSTDPVAEDPAMGAYTPCFVGGMRELACELGLPEGTYDAIDFSVNSEWDWSQRRGSLASLENALRRNAGTRLLFASGIFDLVCVPGTVRHLVQNSTLPRERVRIAEYESGHMPYLGESSASELEHDLRELIAPRG